MMLVEVSKVLSCKFGQNKNKAMITLLWPFQLEIYAKQPLPELPFETSAQAAFCGGLCALTALWGIRFGY
jgi:hypothetical protein